MSSDIDTLERLGYKIRDIQEEHESLFNDLLKGPGYSNMLKEKKHALVNKLFYEKIELYQTINSKLSNMSRTEEQKLILSKLLKLKKQKDILTKSILSICEAGYEKRKKQRN